MAVQQFSIFAKIIFLKNFNILKNDTKSALCPINGPQNLNDRLSADNIVN